MILFSANRVITRWLAGVILLVPILPCEVAVAETISVEPRVLRIAPRDTSLWLATTDGLVEVVPTRGQSRVWREEDGLPSSVIHDVAWDVDGTLWVATIRGPGRRSGETFEPVTKGLRAKEVICLLPLPSGELFAGTDRGVGRLVGSRWEMLYETHEFGRDRVLACARDAGGRAWFAKARSLFLLEPDGGMQVLYRHPFHPDRKLDLLSSRATALSISPAGVLWLGTDAGLLAFDGQRTLSRTSWRPGLWGKEGLLARGIWSIWVETETTVWVSFGDHLPGRPRVLKGNPIGGDWTVIPVGEQKSWRAVYQIIRDPAGTLWAATSDGLYRWLEDRFLPWPLASKR